MSAYIQTLDSGIARARKRHWCYDCKCEIAKGQTFHYGKFVMDGRAYTLRHHHDCHAASADYIDRAGLSWYDMCDGIQPLLEMMEGSGDTQIELDAMRGHFPHVVARIELRRIKAEFAWKARLIAGGHTPHPDDFQEVYG